MSHSAVTPFASGSAAEKFCPPPHSASRHFVQNCEDNDFPGFIPTFNKLPKNTTVYWEKRFYRCILLQRELRDISQIAFEVMLLS